MKSPHVLRLFLLASFISSVGAAVPAGNREVVSKQTKTLGLPRLVDLAVAKPHETEVIDLGSVSAVPGQFTPKKQTGISYVEIASTAQWKRQPAGGEVIYATFTAQVSPGSSVALGGGRLHFVRGKREGHVGMTYVDGATGEMVSINHELPLRPLGPVKLATFSSGTFLLDTVRGRWSLFKGYRPIIYDVPLASAERQGREFVVGGGEAGAWLSGLVFGRANPLFDDENNNGIDDTFEVRELQRLARHEAERSDLYPKWKEYLRKQPIVPIRIMLPGPSGLALKPKEQK